MPPNIMIVGSAGSGKSTLAIKLGQITGARVYHMDRLQWDPNWQRLSDEDAEMRVREAVNTPGWIIEGNYSASHHIRAEKADLIIWLNIPRYICLWRAFKRMIRNYGRHRPDMPDGCTDKFSWDFLLWIWNHPKNGVPKIKALLENAPCPHVVLNNTREVSAFLQNYSSDSS